MRFAKGHGTGNDFVLLPDPDGELELTPARVAAICDRRFGLGADGVLRVVRSAKVIDGTGLAGEAEWFMDYRNADGSVAEMCGNGVRVFVRYLVDRGLAAGPVVPVGTRAGLVRATVHGATVAVRMAAPTVGTGSTAVVAGQPLAGTVVDVGNPHLVCPVPELSTVDLSAAPVLDPTVFPAGANVEFTVPAPALPEADRHVAMRVYERGAAETLSCGTGACAVAAVALRDAGLTHGRVAVDLPGGRLVITLDAAGCELSGPAVLVADGELYR